MGWSWKLPPVLAPDEIVRFLEATDKARADADVTAWMAGRSF